MNSTLKAETNPALQAAMLWYKQFFAKPFTDIFGESIIFKKDWLSIVDTLLS